MVKVNYKNPLKDNMRTQTTLSFTEVNLLNAYYSIVKNEYRSVSDSEAREMFLGASKDYIEAIEPDDSHKEDWQIYKECVLNYCIHEIVIKDNFHKAMLEL